MPISIGTGASNISISGTGKMGTKARHQLKGYKSELKANIVEDIRFYFPTKTIDFSNKIALNN